MSTKYGTEYDEHKLDAIERPKYLYEYFVTGTGPFPIDMLRHDSCWPASGEEAAKIEWSFTARLGGERARRQSIKLRSYRGPTIGRWNSFTWKVTSRAQTLPETPPSAP